MKKRTLSPLLRILLLCVFAFSTTGTASAAASPVSFDGHHTWTVRPLNKVPSDPLNIQRAVDLAKAGDKIVLGAGTFNFGDFESVSVYKDLTIQGAWDATHRKPLTIIKGGFAPLALGRIDPGFKPETMIVKGHKVWHITKEPEGQFYFPFLYPPFFDQEAMTWVKEYKMEEHWAQVNVTVRQITFVRPYLTAIYNSATNGGTIERCHFISAWPIQGDIWGGGGGPSMAIQWWNIQGSLGWAEGEGFDIPPVENGSDYVHGDMLVRDNVFEGEYNNVLAGAKDSSGHLIFKAFDGHSAPPGNDYANYVIQDVYANPSMFYFHPEETPAQYWVRKGYDLFWQTIDDQQKLVADNGQGYGVQLFDTEMNLTIKGNFFHNHVLAVSDGSPNGQFGVPLNLIVEGNTFTADMHPSMNLWTEAVLVSDWYGGSPGTNVAVKNNRIDWKVMEPGVDPVLWNASAIDIEVQGQVLVSGNTVKTRAEGGIAIWGPAQNGLVKSNKISGSGPYAFASFFNTGTQFINNTVSRFTPTDPGVYDPGGWGLPYAPLPASRGVLYATDSNLVQGIGTPGALDIVYNCGSNNTIINMTAMPCTEAATTLSAMRGQSAPQHRNPFMGKRWQYPLR